MYATGAVLEPAAGIGNDGEIEHELDPIVAAHHLRERDLSVLGVAVQAGSHGQQVLDRHALLPRIEVGDAPLTEHRHHRLSYAGQLVPPDGDADEGGGDALGHRGEVVQQAVLEWPEVRVQHDVAVAHDRQTVDRDLPLTDVVEGFGQHSRVHPLLFGGGVAPAAGGPVHLLRSGARDGAGASQAGEGADDGDSPHRRHVPHWHWSANRRTAHLISDLPQAPPDGSRLSCGADAQQAPRQFRLAQSSAAPKRNSSQDGRRQLQALVRRRPVVVAEAVAKPGPAAEGGLRPRQRAHSVGCLMDGRHGVALSHTRPGG